MKVMILESDPKERDEISKMLEHCDIKYVSTITRAINSLGLEHVDKAFVDADYQNKIYDWKELTSFLQALDIDYSVFSSNGKVGFKDGIEIISIKDLAEFISVEVPEVV